MNRFFSSIEILRPLNMFLCLLAVFISAWLIGGIFSPLLPYVILVVLCFAGASNILNDILDIHIDKVNRPNRVLPSGRLSIQHAFVLMCSLYAVAIFSCTYLQLLGRQIALIIVFPLLVLYTPFLKSLPLVGNIIVGSILGLVFLFTEAAISGNIDQMWIPFFFATVLSIIRELCKDAADMMGDAAKSLQTFPRKFGLISTLLFLRIVAVVLCIVTISFYITGYYGIIYMICLILGVQVPMLHNLFFVLNENSKSNDYSKAAKTLKGVTIAGLFVILSTGF